MKEAEFRIQDILPIALTLVVAGIGIAYGLNVMGDIKEDSCDGSLDHWLSSDQTCLTCPNGTYSVFASADNTCNNGTASFNASATEIGSIDYNSTSDAMEGVSNISSKFPTIATIIVASIIIGVLVTYIFTKTM